MSRIVGLCCAYYGCDYIAYALRAIAPFCDEVFVFLTDTPSHGTTTNLVCPDSPEEMMAAICGAGIGDKLRVVRGRWNNEGEHRNEIFKYANDGDLIVVCDADEIWDSNNLMACISLMNAHPEIPMCRVRMVTLYRSFGWYCTDPMTQERLIRVGADRIQNASTYSPYSQLPERPDIWHLGYARMPKDVEYKQSIHGHVGEWRQGWFQEKFLGWTPTNYRLDCHPTCVGFWNPQPFDKNLLPEDLKTHPYWNKDVIE
jgi:hypothetical protein